MAKKKLHIDQIPLLKESFKVPEGYFQFLEGKLEDAKKSNSGRISIDQIPPLQNSFEVPEGYFDNLMDKIEERKTSETNVVAFRSRRIKVWGSFVAAACAALVIISVINWGGGENTQVAEKHPPVIKISDHEVASLMDDRDDEFELTEDEIIDVIEHETAQSESTAIINYLEEENDLGTDEDFLETI